jgi:hypothetical protein
VPEDAWQAVCPSRTLPNHTKYPDTYRFIMYCIQVVNTEALFIFSLIAKYQHTTIAYMMIHGLFLYNRLRRSRMCRRIRLELSTDKYTFQNKISTNYKPGK